MTREYIVMSVLEADAFELMTYSSYFGAIHNATQI